MIRACVGLFLPIVAIWLALRAARLRTSADARLLTAVLACALGIGWSSISTLWFVRQGVPVGPGFVVADALLWTIVASAAWWRHRRTRGEAAPPGSTSDEATRLTAIHWLVRGGFTLVAVVAVAALAMEYVRAPHGQWDAWAIWNQKARFLFRGGDQWDAMLAISWSNPGHPMLVSTSVARLWAYAGSELTIIPAGLALIFGAAIVAAVMSALGLRSTRAWVAGAVLLAPGTFIHQIAAQTADLPFALFTLLTLIMLRDAGIASEQTDRSRAHMLLAGICVGIAAWTKNEGLVLVAVTTLLVGWTCIRAGRIQRLVWWTTGAAPVALTVIWYKLVIAPVPPEYMSGSQTLGDLAARILDPAQHALVGRLVGPFWLNWGGSFATGLLPLVMAVAIVVSLSKAQRPLRIVLGTLALMCVGYYIVWLVSPLDTAWLVSTTFERLMVQLWPSLILVAFGGGRGNPDAPAREPHDERVYGSATTSNR